VNILILKDDEVIETGKALIKGERAGHLLNVKKVKPGDNIKVGRLNDRIGKGTVTSADREKVFLDFALTEKPPPPSELLLICALPRPKSLKKTVHAAVSSGIKTIYFIESWKVEKSYWLSPLLEKEQINEQVMLALEQAVDTVAPEIFFRKRFKPFLEDEVPSIVHGRTALIAEPHSRRECPFNISGPVAIAVGPEGGFTEYESGLFEKAGFEKVNIGNRILRVEFAVAAIAGRISNI